MPELPTFQTPGATLANHASNVLNLYRDTKASSARILAEHVPYLAVSASAIQKSTEIVRGCNNNDQMLENVQSNLKRPRMENSYGFALTAINSLMLTVLKAGFQTCALNVAKDKQGIFDVGL